MAQVIKGAGSFGSNLGGALGTGLGSGISESLPKEMDRLNLKRGLEALANSKETDPIKLASSLATLRGGSPELTNALLPFLLNRRKDQEFMGDDNSYVGGGTPEGIGTSGGYPSGNGVGSSGGAQGGGYVPQQRQGAQGNQDFSSIVSRESDAALTDVPVPPTQSDIRQKARELVATQPTRYTGKAEQAEADAARMLDRDFQARQTKYQKAEKQQQATDTFRKDFRNRLTDTLSLSGDNDFSKLDGNQIRAFENMAEENFASKKMTKEKAIRSAVDEAREFYKSKLELGNMGGPSIFQDRKTNVRALDTIREQYKKAGRLEDLYNDLQKQWGLSPAMASFYAYPIEGKQAGKAIRSIPKTGFNYSAAERDKRLTETAMIIGQNIGDNNVQSMVTAAAQNGYEPKELMDRIEQLEREKKFKLGSSQLAEFGRAQPSAGSQMFNLADKFYSSFINDKIPQG